jgi:hypothetical protein
MVTFNEPMGLPQGSVRAIITILLILAVIGMSFTGGFINEIISTMAVASFGHYFGARATETNAATRAESEVLVNPQNGEAPEELSVISGKDLQ